MNLFAGMYIRYSFCSVTAVINEIDLSVCTCPWPLVTVSVWQLSPSCCLSTRSPHLNVEYFGTLKIGYSLIFCKNSTENYLLSVYIASCRKVTRIFLTKPLLRHHVTLPRVEIYGREVNIWKLYLNYRKSLSTSNLKKTSLGQAAAQAALPCVVRFA